MANVFSCQTIGKNEHGFIIGITTTYNATSTFKN